MTTDLERAYRIANALKLETVEEVWCKPSRAGIVFRDGRQFYTEGFQWESGEICDATRDSIPGYYYWDAAMVEDGDALLNTDLFLPLEALKVLIKKENI